MKKNQMKYNDLLQFLLLRNQETASKMSNVNQNGPKYFLKLFSFGLQCIWCIVLISFEAAVKTKRRFKCKNYHKNALLTWEDYSYEKFNTNAVIKIVINHHI